MILAHVYRSLKALLEVDSWFAAEDWPIVALLVFVLLLLSFSPQKVQLSVHSGYFWQHFGASDDGAPMYSVT